MHIHMYTIGMINSLWRQVEISALWCECLHLFGWIRICSTDLQWPSVDLEHNFVPICMLKRWKARLCQIYHLNVILEKILLARFMMLQTLECRNRKNPPFTVAFFYIKISSGLNYWVSPLIHFYIVSTNVLLLMINRPETFKYSQIIVLLQKKFPHRSDLMGSWPWTARTS